MQLPDAREVPEGFGNAAHVAGLLDRLKAKHGWFQRDVAERLGVDIRTVRKWKARGAPYVVVWALEVVG